MEYELYRYNLKPFEEIKRFIRYRELIGFEGFIVNIVGNVIAFVPFGMFLPVLTKERVGFWFVFLSGLQFTQIGRAHV